MDEDRGLPGGNGGGTANPPFKGGVGGGTLGRLGKPNLDGIRPGLGGGGFALGGGGGTGR